jgi:malic enzyme
VFPGIGLGAIACRARILSDEMFLEAARVLAEKVDDYDLATGSLYPPLANIRKVSLAIAVAVAETAWEQGLAQEVRPADVERMIAEQMYDLEYQAQIIVTNVPRVRTSVRISMHTMITIHRDKKRTAEKPGKVL